MQWLHVICKSLLNVSRLGGDVYESGYWPVKGGDATRLVGGILCLHESKTERSYFGGVVEGFRLAGAAYQEDPARLIFTFRAVRDAKSQRWRGRNDPMAYVGGVVSD